MTTLNPSPLTEATVELKPSYKIPLVLILAAIPLLLVQPWVSLVISLFGLFLMLQAATIKLKFTNTDLDIYRSEELIRRFPYVEWYSWQIFWEPVPILFYFKEVNSIHFLPILFEPKTLVACLEKYCPKQG
ncbi:MAG: DUF3119 family protein [Gomphosphaeria aponina SAG 52.96 = DSM 107014]|uniref:DUF3119 family protein n=1 Tax=Gomphosphaeria aponina SAG 52.96 = DSM 107014 TaxID=1521640 RepID=A0A941GWP2_9CHRO|nr:DUF3119 family protein [Gomphosphaeria aponina SAG 52.96 = DSM 107014]